ncbi:hypothetical protein [Burkholderia sp. NLJ2]|uniref:hypothetical protein n=1 Tax=Burkholderia sp. NLJ2 TaxID=3090699 RepID=UPI003C6C3BA3
MPTRSGDTDTAITRSFPVEIVGHRVAQARVAVHVDDPRPVDDRLVALALERVQLATDRVVGVAAGRGHRHQLLEVREDQVQDLRRADFEHPLAEEELQRIAELVARDLQDAFVDREHDDLRGLCRMHGEGGRIARLHERWRIDAQRIAARVEVHRERHDAVAQRAHEDLVRRRIADVLHVDVAVAFETGRHRDVLDRARRIRMEPCVRIHLVALDRDQPLPA